MLTEKEIDELIHVGCIVDIPAVDAAAQLNQHFPDIDLIGLMTELDQLLDQHTLKPVYKRFVIDATPEPFFEIIYRSANHDDPKHGLKLIRSFHYEEEQLIAKHVYFTLPEGARNQKTGTKVLAAFLDQYLKMGVSRIELYTGLKDGGAVWAKMGFNALYKHEMEDILQTATGVLRGTAQLDLIKGIFDAYYKKEPNGKSFPIRRWADIDEMDQILKEHSWHGWIDLTNKEELRNFKENVGR